MLALIIPLLLQLALAANHIPNAKALNRSVFVLPSPASGAVCPWLPILEGFFFYTCKDILSALRKLSSIPQQLTLPKLRVCTDYLRFSHKLENIQVSVFQTCRIMRGLLSFKISRSASYFGIYSSNIFCLVAN